MGASFVQSAKNSSSGSGATSVAKAFTSNVTAGNLLIAAVGFYRAASGGWVYNKLKTSVSDSQGNVWSLVGAIFTGGNSNVAIFRAIAGTSGSCTVTAVPFGSTSVPCDLVVAEYSGVAPFVDGLQIDGGGLTSMTVPTIDVFNASGAVIIAADYDQTHTSTPSYSTNFTVREYTANPNAESLCLADHIVGSPGTYGGETLNLSVSSTAIAMVVAGFAQAPLALGYGSPVPTAQVLPGGVTGVAYSETIGAQSGASPYTFAVTSGSLPASLSLNSSTGVISGTPSATGTSSFTITATDANGATGSTSFQIKVSNPASGGGGSYAFVA